jgi:hypothetical protein
MTSFLRPHALPEELDRGYLGFAMTLNGMSSVDEALRQISSCLMPARPAADTNLVESLACVANLSVDDFVQCHTTRPLREAIAPTVFNERRRAVRSERIDPVGCSSRKGWYFCPACAQADLEFHGRSYWRRDLQFPGQLWCPKHAMALRYIVSDEKALPSPLVAQSTSEEVPQSLVDAAINNQLVARYLDICAGFLQHRESVDNSVARRIIQHRAKEKGIALRRRAAPGPLLSDMIMGLFPSSWLATVMPALASNETAEAAKHIENVIYVDARSFSCSTYVLAASVVFDSAEEALNALFNSEPPTKRKGSGSRQAPSSIASPCKTLRDSTVATRYAACRGNLTKTALQLGVSMARTERALAKLGLPSLGVSSCHARERALGTFLIDGKNIQETCEESGLDSNEVETLLRTCCANMTSTLIEMRRVGSAPRANRTRARSMTPKDVHAMLERSQLASPQPTDPITPATGTESSERPASNRMNSARPLSADPLTSE